MIWLIAGTRPELIKLWPLAARLHMQQRDAVTITTGQHTTLADGMPLTPDIALGLPGTNDPCQYVLDATDALVQWAQYQPDPTMIVVQGDTASALAGARLGERLGIPVCHVEAGLRSFHDDDPWPEEGFRKEIDRLSALRCAPTVTSLGNLLAEGLEHGSHLTGNTITDALRLMSTPKQPPAHVLITLHRRESFGQAMRDCVEALIGLAYAHRTLTFRWPLHPNPHVREALGTGMLPGNLLLTDPLPYPAFLNALTRSHCVLTDSGGLVEECTTLGIPALVCRNHTERPEALASGHATLVGRDGRGLANHFPLALRAHLPPSTTYGTGHSADTIAALLPT